MILLPKKAGKVIEVASKESGRYDMRCVQVQEFAEDRYHLTATDGRGVVVVVKGCGFPRNKTDIPQKLAEGDQFKYLVPADPWIDAFKLAKKSECVGLSATSGGVKLAAPAGEVIESDHMDGRFPDVMRTVNSYRKKLGGVSVRVMPRALARLLLVAAEFTECGTGAVDLVITDPDTPIAIVTRNSEGETFDALLCPCMEPK